MQRLDHNVIQTCVLSLIDAMREKLTLHNIRNAYIRPAQQKADLCKCHYVSLWWVFVHMRAQWWNEGVWVSWTSLRLLPVFQQKERVGKWAPHDVDTCGQPCRPDTLPKVMFHLSACSLLLMASRFHCNFSSRVISGELPLLSLPD